MKKYPTLLFIIALIFVPVFSFGFDFNVMCLGSVCGNSGSGSAFSNDSSQPPPKIINWTEYSCDSNDTCQSVSNRKLVYKRNSTDQVVVDFIQTSGGLADFAKAWITNPHASVNEVSKTLGIKYQNTPTAFADISTRTVADGQPINPLFVFNPFFSNPIYGLYVPITILIPNSHNPDQFTPNNSDGIVYNKFFYVDANGYFDDNTASGQASNGISLAQNFSLYTYANKCDGGLDSALSPEAAMPLDVKLAMKMALPDHANTYSRELGMTWGQYASQLSPVYAKKINDCQEEKRFERAALVSTPLPPTLTEEKNNAPTIVASSPLTPIQTKEVTTAIKKNSPPLVKQLFNKIIITLNPKKIQRIFGASGSYSHDPNTGETIINRLFITNNGPEVITKVSGVANAKDAIVFTNDERIFVIFEVDTNGQKKKVGFLITKNDVLKLKNSADPAGPTIVEVVGLADTAPLSADALLRRSVALQKLTDNTNNSNFNIVALRRFNRFYQKKAEPFKEKIDIGFLFVEDRFVKSCSNKFNSETINFAC